MRRFLLAMLAAAALAGAPAAAQDDGAEGADDNGFLINLLEDRLSSDSRKIRLSGVEGVLSREATVGLITISDRQGVWLRIENARIDWNRSALLRGRVEVNTLAAERIVIPRRPLPEPAALPEPGARTEFALPDLPVSVRIDTLDVELLRLGAPVAGVAAELAIEGGMTLAGGTLDARLAMTRLDGPGGQFDLTAVIDDGEIDVDLVAEEPQGGIFAGLLNLEGRPPFRAEIQAQGTVDDLTATLDFAVAGEDLLDGTLNVDSSAGPREFAVDVAGRFRPLLPPTLHEFFAAESTLTARGTQRPEGGLVLQSLALDSGALTVSGALTTAPDGLPVTATLDAAIAPQEGDTIMLPGGPRIAGAELAFDWAEDGALSGVVEVSGLQSGPLEVARVGLTLDGGLQNPRQPAARALTLAVDGSASGIGGADPALARALEGRTDLSARIGWQAGAPVELREVALRLGALSATLQGQIADAAFDGEVSVAAPDLGRFAPVVGRDLGGALDVALAGRVAPLLGAFELSVDGTAQDLRLGIPRTDALLAGETVIAGGVSRTAEGLRARDFRLRNPQMRVQADGLYAATGSDLRAEAALADLALVSDLATGAPTITLTLAGGSTRLELDARLDLPEGTLQGRPVRDLSLRVQGGGRTLSRLDGQVRAAGEVGAVAIDGDARFELGDGFQALRGLDLTIGDNRLQGALARGADGLIAGRVDLRAPQVGQIASLALMEAAGAVDMRLVASRRGGGQSLSAEGRVSGLAVPGLTARGADLDLAIDDLLGVPLADGTVRAEGVTAGGFVLNRLSLQADRLDSAMDVALSAALQDGTTVDLGGRLANLQPGLSLEARRLDLARGPETARLTAPATLTVRDGALTLTPLQIALARGGAITAEGRVAETLDVDVALDRVPLALADLFAPALAARGTLDGSVRVTGPRAAPVAEFSLGLARATAAPLAAAGLPPLSLSAEGSADGTRIRASANAVADGLLNVGVEGTLPYDPQAEGLDLGVTLDRLSLDALSGLAPRLAPRGQVIGTARVTGSLAAPQPAFDLRAEGLSAAPLAGAPPLALALSGTPQADGVRVEGALTAGSAANVELAGQVPLAVDGAMALDLDIGGLSLSLLNGLLPDRGLAGGIAGTARITGTPAVPQVAFDLTGSALSEVTMRRMGISGVSLGARGRYGSGVLVLDQARLADPEGAVLTARGAVPLSGAGLDLDVSGEAPLQLLNVALARSRTQLGGTLSLDAQLRGALADPRLTGTAAIRDGTLIFQPANLALEGLSADARLSGNQVILDRATADLAGGGRARMTGSLRIAPGAGFPADLQLTLEEARYSDGRLIDTTLDGEVALTGPVTGAGLLTGRLAVARAEISIPSRFGINQGVLLDIRHRNPPRDVRLTLNRAGLVGADARPPRRWRRAAAAAGSGNRRAQPDLHPRPRAGRRDGGQRAAGRHPGRGGADRGDRADPRAAVDTRPADRLRRGAGHPGRQPGPADPPCGPDRGAGRHAGHGDHRGVGPRPAAHPAIPARAARGRDPGAADLRARPVGAVAAAGGAAGRGGRVAGGEWRRRRCR